MATIVHSSGIAVDIRVAVIIEAGKVRPVWFEERGRSAPDRIFVRKVNQVWSHHQGSAKILNFAVSTDSNNYELSLDTQEFTWELKVVEQNSFP